MSNKISHIDDEAFANLHSLENLDLIGNNIVTISSLMFLGLYRLKHLDLRRNKISTIPEGVFNHMNFLQSLSLAENRISTIGRWIRINYCSILNYQGGHSGFCLSETPKSFNLIKEPTNFWSTSVSNNFSHQPNHCIPPHCTNIVWKAHFFTLKKSGCFVYKCMLLKRSWILKPFLYNFYEILGQFWA